MLDVARAIPELVFGLILVVTVGIGPLAGALALGLHSAGVLGKLYAESFENVPVGADRIARGDGRAHAADRRVRLRPARARTARRAHAVSLGMERARRDGRRA